MKGKIVVVQSSTIELPVGQRVLLDQVSDNHYNVFPLSNSGKSRNHDIITFHEAKFSIWACGEQRMKITGVIGGKPIYHSVTFVIQ